ncbi:hypothetical protein [Paenibacillus beijingensis]|uniref:Cupin n=1 Tax=Paenibacillus beijingensis TaxID=1126833 RepID=A0A0D5NMR6_9BACL|nr:hypothetical protein [Paenibacillus beijingensis]AJY76198.1 cupin [Paenibacillus beijingensis]
MRIFQFDKETGKSITDYGSKNSFFSRIIKHNKPIHIGCIFVGQDGVVGLHEATIKQLFLIVNGEGWVKGKEGIQYNIKSGFAALWELGEVHESGSELGMTAIVIESDDLEPQMNEVNLVDG